VVLRSAWGAAECGRVACVFRSDGDLTVSDLLAKGFVARDLRRARETSRAAHDHGGVGLLAVYLRTTRR